MQPMSRYETAKQEAELKKNVSVTAALALALDAVKHQLDDPKLLKARRDMILKHEDTGNREVMGILCLLSSHIGDYKFCDHFLESVEKAGDPYFGFEIYRIATARGDDAIAQKYLRSSAAYGYIPARKMKVGLKMKKLGPIGRIGNAAYALYLAGTATVILARNSNDKRLPRV